MLAEPEKASLGVVVRWKRLIKRALNFVSLAIVLRLPVIAYCGLAYVYTNSFYGNIERSRIGTVKRVPKPENEW